jgi:hypothetical protein
VFPDVGQNQIGRNRCDLIEACFAELTLHLRCGKIDRLDRASQTELLSVST